jgi:glycosyltransferase involved in cell wall biosynthesis
VNDCTPDQSIEIIQKVLNEYPQRKEHVKIINHDKNRGLAASRNTGIENAGGEYVLHIDSDDYIELDMVELMFGKAKEEDADIVLCDFNIKWKDTQKIAPQHFTDKDQYLRDILNTKAMPGVVNKLIRRSLYLDNGIFPFEGINLGEDYVTTPKLISKARRISKVNKPLYHYIQYNEGSYTAIINQKAIDDLWFVLNELYNYFKSTKEFSLLKNDILKGQLIKKLDVVGRVNNEKRREVYSLSA